MVDTATTLAKRQPALAQNQYLCTICNKTYKTFHGLIRHENSAHRSYNQPPADLISLPPQHIEQFKRLLVNEIHKKLSLHYTKTGKQLIKFPCTDSEFVAVFGNYLSRFSPAKRTYCCIFKDYNAEHTLRNLLGDEQWGTRYYQDNQKSYVQLYLQENKIDEDVSNIKTIKVIPPEMTVEWFQEKIKDIKGHQTLGGQLRIRFRINQEHYS
ncbi:852_t:CDS:1 [Cetraspora pellucida]|uniref:852_t:CDS:1 n=1 Tax=Cetraspora pellucida TaxID=1433469 RepID=A0ACA9PAY2_9GLOM|nr:852_t:CDS:1 [Cetraspora pellucida]